MAITKVTTDVITDGAVTAPKLATDSVTADKLAANSVTAAKIAAGTLTDQVANNSITAAKIPNATALTLDGGVTIDNINIDGTTMALSSGDLTLDVAGDINLDADGAQIRLKDGGTEFGVFSHESPNLIIKPQVQDGDLVIKGDDGGNTITAMTIDMSAGGNVGIGDTSPARVLSAKSSSVTVGSFESTSASGGMIGFVDSNTTNDVTVRVGALGDNLVLQAGGAEKMRITSAGRVGIGDTVPDNFLDVDFDITGEGSNQGGIKIQNSHGVNNDFAPLYFGVHGGTRRTKAAIGLKREGSYGIGSLIFAMDANGDDANVTFANDEVMRINSSGVVNIGTASGTQPSYFNSYLNVQNNASTSNSSSITITAGSGGYAGLHFGDSDNGRIGQVAYNNSDNTLLFTANNSERMRITSDGLLPATTSTYDLGSSSLRWANLYTGDLHLSNEGSEGNEVDGTSGDWTIQEGDEHLYIKNNKSGKKYRFALEEIE